jgi:hypothetical protein
VELDALDLTAFEGDRVQDRRVDGRLRSARVAADDQLRRGLAGHDERVEVRAALAGHPLVDQDVASNARLTIASSWPLQLRSPGKAPSSSGRSPR